MTFEKPQLKTRIGWNFKNHSGIEVEGFLSYNPPGCPLVYRNGNEMVIVDPMHRRDLSDVRVGDGEGLLIFVYCESDVLYVVVVVAIVVVFTVDGHDPYGFISAARHASIPRFPSSLVFRKPK